MARKPKTEARQVPPFNDRAAWAEFRSWLKGCQLLKRGDSLQALTIVGWVHVDPQDWLLRLPGRELYHFTAERWAAAGKSDVTA